MLGGGLGAQRAVSNLGGALARVRQEREGSAEVVEDVVCVRVSMIAQNATTAPPTTIALMQRSMSARERTPEATSTNTIGNVRR